MDAVFDKNDMTLTVKGDMVAYYIKTNFSEMGTSCRTFMQTGGLVEGIEEQKGVYTINLNTGDNVSRAIQMLGEMNRSDLIPELEKISNGCQRRAPITTH